MCFSEISANLPLCSEDVSPAVILPLKSHAKDKISNILNSQHRRVESLCSFETWIHKAATADAARKTFFILEEK